MAGKKKTRRRLPFAVLLSTKAEIIPKYASPHINEKLRAKRFFEKSDNIFIIVPLSFNLW